MRIGEEPPEVGHPVSTVMVDGRMIEAASVTTVRELGGSPVPGRSSTPSAEGTVVWAQVDDVQDGPGPSPLRRRAGIPPVLGAPVTVDVGTVEAGTHRALSAVVDSSAGTADGVVTSSLIDPVDQLHRSVSMPPMQAFMPPTTPYGPTRLVGLMPDTVVASILRDCGYHNTPADPPSFVGVSAPMQGSAWPTVGECVTASAKTTAAAIPVTQTPTGIAIHQGRATYAPSGAVRLSGGMVLAVAAVRGQGDAWSVIARFNGRTDQVRLISTASGIFVQSSPDGTTWTSHLTAGHTAVGAWDRAAADVTSTGVRLVLSQGGSVVHSVTASVAWPTGLATSTVSQVDLDATSPVSGVQAGVGGTATAYATAPLNFIRRGDLTGRVSATPAIVARDALDVLLEIADATLQVFWWDEDGVLHWDSARRLRDQGPVAILTSVDDLIDLSWSESLSDTYRQIRVDYGEPITRRNGVPATDLWQGRGGTIEVGGLVEEIITVPSDEDWIMPDLAPRDTGRDLPDFNAGLWSWLGGVAGTPTVWSWQVGTMSGSIERITDQTFKVSIAWTGAEPLVQRTLPESYDGGTSLADFRRNFDLPIIRGYARTIWEPTNALYGSGPAAGAEYKHDAGRWVGDDPSTVGTFLAEWLTVPHMRASGVEINHDPRLQVGDVVQVRDKDAFGIELKALIVKIEQTTDASDQTMHIDMEVLSGASTVYTLADHTADQGAGTLNEHTAGMAGSTLSDHTVTPSH